MALTTKRIIALPSQSDPQEGDYLAIDNATSGTHKIPVGRIGVEVDDTLTEAGKAADAKAVGDALGEIRSQAEATEDAIDEIRSQIEVTGTASGAIATFTDGADMPAKSVVVNITPKQSGTGTPSPENERPISGWESVTIADYAVNMLTEQTNEKRPCFIKKGTPIVASAKKDGTGNVYFYYYRADGTQIDYWALSGTTDGRAWRSITPTEDVYFVAFLGSGVTLSERQVRLAGGQESIMYNPTLAHAYAVNLGRTVYGGDAEIVGGSLMDKMAMVTFNGTENWYSVDTSGTDRNRALYADIDSPTGQYNVNLIGNYITSTEQADSYPQLWKANINAAGNLLIGIPKTITTIAEWKAYLAQNPLQLCYELATPQTYTLTGQEISTLLGENNVWADSGDVEVVYVRDLNIAINNLLNNSGTRSLGMMAMSAPTEATAEEQTDEKSDEDMR